MSKTLTAAMATGKTESTAMVSTEIMNGMLHMAFKGVGVLILDPEQCSATIRDAAMMHGFKQKLGDAAALSRNPDTGRSASIQDKYNFVQEVFDRLTSPDGTWNKVRGDGTGASGAGGLLVRALIRLYDGAKSVEEIRAYASGLTPEQQAALRANKKVAPIILAIKAEDAARKAETGEGETDDSDALLAGLGGLPD